jgi:hypothetical protein
MQFRKYIVAMNIKSVYMRDIPIQPIHCIPTIL